MIEINLFNRDGANLRLVKTPEKIDDNTFVWKLEVDSKHDYVLHYCRFICAEHDNNIFEAIDPSGGPFIALGNVFKYKYKIVKINSAKNIWIRENHND